MSSGLGLCLAAVLVAPASARADDTTCIDAHVEAQRLQKSGKARAAREMLVECAKPTCPTMLVSECTTMLVEVEKSIPTIVLSAKAGPSDVGDVEVRVGEALLAPRLDGKAIELDPGEHTFVFRRGKDEQRVTVIVLEGDKNRPISVTFPDKTKPDPGPEEPGAGGERVISPGFWISGSVGLAGLVLFAGLGGAGLAKKSGLDDRACSPFCPSNEVDEVRGLFLGADISLGIGLAGLAVAPIFYFTSPVTARAPAGSGALSLSIGASALSLEVSF